MCLVNKETNAYSNDDYWTWHGDLKEGMKTNVCILSGRQGQSLLDPGTMEAQKYHVTGKSFSISKRGS